MRIYLDNCCYNRLFDDKTQERVQVESDALKAILVDKKDIIVGSHFLKFEISKIKACDKLNLDIKVTNPANIKESD